MPSKENVADIFTKVLDRRSFLLLRAAIMGARGCPPQCPLSFLVPQRREGVTGLASIPLRLRVQCTATCTVVCDVWDSWTLCMWLRYASLHALWSVTCGTHDLCVCGSVMDILFTHIDSVRLDVK